jgi:hypothetical protein
MTGIFLGVVTKMNTVGVLFNVSDHFGSQIYTGSESTPVFAPGTFVGTAGTLTITDAVTDDPVPGPIAGAGLPGLILGFAGIGFMAYRRKSRPALIAAFLLGVVIFPSSRARADVLLTFDATYTSRVIFNGPNATTDPNFQPVSFSFSVSFDPTVILTLGPTFSSGPFTAPDGVAGTYSAVTANTIFGPPTFSSSPVTSALRAIAGGNLNNTYSSTSENEAYNSWSRYFTNSGSRAIAVSTGGVNPQGSNLYWFEAGTYPGGDPQGLSEVGPVTSQNLLNDLQTAASTRPIIQPYDSVRANTSRRCEELQQL